MMAFSAARHSSWSLQDRSDGGRILERRAGYWRSDPIGSELGSNASDVGEWTLRMGGRLRIRCINRTRRALPANCQGLPTVEDRKSRRVLDADDRGSTWQAVAR